MKTWKRSILTSVSYETPNAPLEYYGIPNGIRPILRMSFNRGFIFRLDGLSNPINIKILILGDSFVGKTSLIKTICKAPYTDYYVPTICDNMETTVEIGGRKIKLNLWDTAGNDIQERFGNLTYAVSDVALVCFSVDIPSSIVSAATNWVPIVRHHCPHVPIILVGCKSDLRFHPQRIIGSPESVNQEEVTPQSESHLLSMEEGYAMASRIGAFLYLETSAKKKFGIDALLTLAANVGLNERKCTVCTIA